MTRYHLRTIDNEGYAINLLGAVPPNFQHGDSSQVYSLNASCYCGPMESLIKHRTFHTGSPKAYPMNKVTGIDIDTLEQFKIAETLYKMLKS